ncbi:MAG: hypothetical protein DRP11_00350 [Candidatus Aenigmatarchaeota archaeon]|nr:MAG: hypothetical protein DRP11_00350 [Candidatus Aenigmarchaeota archaeon]
MKKIYKFVGNVVPYKEKIREQLDYAGFETTPAVEFSGFMFFYGLSAGFLLFGLFTFLNLSLPLSLLGFAIGFLGLQGLIYMILVMIADSRANEVDEILPDALQLMSANIRAGMTMDRAIWLAARPEFGPLEREIHRVGAEVLGGKSMVEALEGMKKRINSVLLRRALKLVEEGIESGGEMGHLLDETANDIRTAKAMKDQVKSNVMMYSLFIIFASVIGAPLLFAVSLYFVEITNELWSQTMPGTEDLFNQMGGLIKFGGPQVGVEELQLFATATIILTTVFGSLIIGLIQTGKERNGLKYMPFLTGTALVIFFVAKILISSVLGSLVGF